MTKDMVDQWVDKYRFPITLTIIFIIQTTGFIFFIAQWTTRADMRLDQVLTVAQIVSHDSERILTLEVNAANEKALLEKIDRQLDKIIDAQTKFYSGGKT